MAQIAERAGVALSTVSYVLSGKRSVSDEMRARVLAAIEELDYRPHRPARALASGTSRTIALFLPSPTWQLVPVQQTFVAGATEATSAGDYALLLSTSPADPETVARVVASRPRRRRDPDGDARRRSARRAPEGRRPPVRPDRPNGRHDRHQLRRRRLRRGRRKSLAHLDELGHRCVALFNFPPDQLAAGYTSALIARDAFEATTAELGIRGIHLPCPHPAEEALAVATELLRSEPDCTAAITTGWQFTGLLSALRAADLHVPDDFSIVSVIAAQYAEMLTPALTGIEWPAFEAGRLAAELLIERLRAASAPPHQYLIGGELVVRESTGPAPTR